MIRIQTGRASRFIRHRDRAELAARLASRWGNARFPRPEPVAPILEALAQSTDDWLDDDSDDRRDRARFEAIASHRVDADGLPLGTSLERLLMNRGRAVDAIAKDHPVAAALLSYHTVQLLTAPSTREQVRPAECIRLQAFLDRQSTRQAELLHIAAVARQPTEHVVDSAWMEQACALFSICSHLAHLLIMQPDRPSVLPVMLGDRRARPTEIKLDSIGPGVFQVRPHPFADKELRFEIPYREVTDQVWSERDALEDACMHAPQQSFQISVVQVE